MQPTVIPIDAGRWPRALRLLVEAIATAFMRGYWLSRCRAADHASALVRLVAERDDALWRSAMAERMLAVQLRRIAAMNPLRRPEILPADRFEVLQIIRLQGWSVREAARRFVLHKN
ncbi:MAG TPA: hypothetical protein PK280_01020, partial [Planctomycetota bacterium]|nr:hypothetical protein [Planctomycetota bacterium]